MQNQKRFQAAQWTVLELLKWATSYFLSKDIEDPRVSAELLLSHSLNLERIDLYLRYDQPVTGQELARFKSLVVRRLNREPVAYIVGVKEFWSITLEVSREVLIPRPDTECLVEAALQLLENRFKMAPNQKVRVLELGTGSGAVALALAAQHPEVFYAATDCSVEAIRVARANAGRHQMGETIGFVAGDWFEPFCAGRCLFDVIISNPPYIPSAEIANLQPEIRLHEPRVALDGGRDGLGHLRHIVHAAHAYLNRNGYLILEIGHDQKDALEKLVDAFGGYEKPAFVKDYGGHDRVLKMRKKEKGTLF